MCHTVGERKKFLSPDEKILPNTVNIGKSVYEDKIMEKISESCNNNLLNNKNLDLKALCKDTFVPVNYEQLKQLVNEQIDKLEQILKSGDEFKDINNVEAIKKCALYDKLIKMIKKWFDLYGEYLYSGNDDIQYFDLYLFLNKCLDYYLVVKEEKEIPLTKHFSKITRGKDDSFTVVEEFESIFDFINFEYYKVLLQRNRIGICQYCGNLYFGKNSGSDFCTENCKSKNHYHKKKAIKND